MGDSTDKLKPTELRLCLPMRYEEPLVSHTHLHVTVLHVTAIYPLGLRVAERLMGVAVARDETNGTRPTLLGFRPTPEALSHKCNAAQEWRRRKAWHPTRFRVGRYGEVSEEASRLSLEGQGRRAGPGRGGRRSESESNRREGGSHRRR